MKILAIESSINDGTVAAMESGRLVREIILDTERRSTQTLAPAIHDLLAEVQWRPADVQLVGISIGPGSFTGLRVGIATGVTFAYAVGARVMGVDTLAASIERLPDDVTEAIAAADAQRGDWMVGHYRRDSSGVWQREGELKLVAARMWLAELASETVLTGPALQTASFKRIWESAENRPTLPDPSIHNPTAAMIAHIANRAHEQGIRQELGDIRPIYSRPSAAEEKLMREEG